MPAFKVMGRGGWLFALPLLLPAGCASSRAAEQAPVAEQASELPIQSSDGPSVNVTSRTIVESLTGPEDFEFVTVVPKRGKKASGWQEACVPFRLMRNTGELYICKLSVELPIENRDGPISSALARRVSADCANQAAQAVFSKAAPATPLFLACEEFKTAYEIGLRAAIAGARIQKVCDVKAERAMKRRGGL